MRPTDKIFEKMHECNNQSHKKAFCYTFFSAQATIAPSEVCEKI